MHTQQPTTVAKLKWARYAAFDTLAGLLVFGLSDRTTDALTHSYPPATVGLWFSTVFFVGFCLYWLNPRLVTADTQPAPRLSNDRVLSLRQTLSHKQHLN